MKKNIENSDMPISSADDVRRRAACCSRKIENGTSGCRRARSISDERRRAATSETAPQAERLRRAPAGVVGVDERVDEQREAGGDRDRAGDVEVRRATLVAALGQQARREQRGGQADRHVDEQHPLPAGPLGQHAAEQHAGGAARAGDRAPDAERLVALGALGERRRDDRQRGGGDERRAEALRRRGRRSARRSLWARPPASDASEKRTRPAMNMRRRPSRSARRPPSSRKPPKISV